jgi:hypothetical protein
VCSNGAQSKRCVEPSTGGQVELNQDFYEFFESLDRRSAGTRPAVLRKMVEARRQGE